MLRCPASCIYTHVSCIHTTLSKPLCFHPTVPIPTSNLLMFCLQSVWYNIGLYWIGLPSHDLIYFPNLNGHVLLGRVQGRNLHLSCVAPAASVWTFCQWGSKKVSATAHWVAYWGYRRGLVKLSCCLCHPRKTNDFSGVPQLWNRPVLWGETFE